MPKRICHLLNVYGDKNQLFTSTLIKNLTKKDDKNDYFVYCHAYKQHLQHINFIVSNYKNKLIVVLKFLVLYIQNSNFRSLSNKLTKRENYKWTSLLYCKLDVLHIHHAHAIPIEVLKFLSAKKVKIVFTLRGKDLAVNTHDLCKREELKEKLVLADTIHCISDFLKDRLFSLYGLTSKVIYRGIENPDAFNIKVSNEKENEIKAISVGRLVWEKGHVFLLESICRLKERGYIIKLDIYGEGYLETFLKFRVNQLGIENLVSFKGYLDNSELKTVYKTYNIAIQSSISEALSNGLIDFMVHNLPCVISNVGGMSEIITNEKNGIVFNVAKMEQLDEAILKALDLDFKELMLHNNKVKGKFSVDTEVEELLKLYKQV
ncbi:glycosyltransferase family 4 protein [Aestuariibaculum marinum]|uniref:Glycosyltransferase family 4 protein n=1 Tax=Aestuariibaculum marinum TaxID=2683592 RepID=A0A8J6U9B9_9FLAO|nr:glycosyltransferase family 4 protein [Aestuariibaculum marinum]MBD0823871.1 glycosyltransferase family 4 protein [Aestuariibaculum marinum]